MRSAPISMQGTDSACRQHCLRDGCSVISGISVGSNCTSGSLTDHECAAYDSAIDDSAAAPQRQPPAGPPEEEQEEQEEHTGCSSGSTEAAPAPAGLPQLQAQRRAKTMAVSAHCPPELLTDDW